jgi:hypothetical protein
MLKYVNRTHLSPNPIDAGPLPTVVLADTGVEEVVPSLNPQACDWDTSIQPELRFRRQLPISETRSVKHHVGES